MASLSLICQSDRANFNVTNLKMTIGKGEDGKLIGQNGEWLQCDKSLEIKSRLNIINWQLSKVTDFKMTDFKIDIFQNDRFQNDVDFKSDSCQNESCQKWQMSNWLVFNYIVNDVNVTEFGKKLSTIYLTDSCQGDMS